MNDSSLYLAAKMLLDSSSSSSSSSEEDFLHMALEMLPKAEREIVKRVLNFESTYLAEWSNEEVCLVLSSF